MRAAASLVVLLSVLAGCSGPAASETPDALQADDAEVVQDAAPVWQNVTHVASTPWDGMTKEGAFVCTMSDGTGSCPAGQQVQPDGRHTTNVSYVGDFVGAVVALAWTPVDASQTGLVLAAYGPGGLLGIVEGTGDLTLVLDQGAPLPTDGSFLLTVWPSAKVRGPPAVFADATRQPFHADVDVTTTTLEQVS